MQKNIIFYDGYCALCHFWVKYVLARDVHDHFLFSPLQGEEIKKRLRTEDIRNLPDSIVLVDTAQKLYVKSDAIIYILKKLGGLNFLLATSIAILPKPLRDYCYEVVARIRKKIFGEKADVCPIISGEERKKILD